MRMRVTRVRMRMDEDREGGREGGESSLTLVMSGQARSSVVQGVKQVSICDDRRSDTS